MPRGTTLFKCTKCEKRFSLGQEWTYSSPESNYIHFPWTLRMLDRGTITQGSG